VELVAGLDDDIGWAGDQILCLEQAINRGLADCSASAPLAQIWGCG